MFNPFKLDFIVRKALEQAEIELNQALQFRQKQFNNPHAQFELRLDENQQARIYLHCPQTQQDLIGLSPQTLIQDPDTQARLNRIPKLVQQHIHWPKILNHIQTKAQAKLQGNATLRARLGPKQALIEIRHNQETAWQKSSLLSFFS